MTILADRVAKLKPSPTLQVAATAAKLKSQGIKLCNLAAGEPDFDTPKPIVEAAYSAMQKGHTRYTPVDGIVPLKEAIKEKIARDNSLSYELEEIIVSTGAKQCLYNAFMALLNKDDEIIIPSPYWVSYAPMAELSQASIIHIHTTIDQSFKFTPEQLEKAISPKTKMLILNSPSNPSGSVYSKSELSALGAVLKKHPHVFIISDDIYESIYWHDEPFCNILNATPELKDRTIVINGVSKSFAMTGWRIGYALGPSTIIKAMKSIQSQSTSNPCSVAQYAALEALTGDQTCLKKFNHTYKQRHDWFIKALRTIDGIKVQASAGSFYCFANITGLMAQHGIKSDSDFCTHMLEEYHLAFIPGSAFGLEGYIRISFAQSQEVLETGIEKLREFAKVKNKDAVL